MYRCMDRFLMGHGPVLGIPGLEGSRKDVIITIQSYSGFFLIV